MSDVADWESLCPATITHRPVTSRTAYGVLTHGTATSYRARVTYNMKRVASMRREKLGTEVIAAGVVWILGLPDIDDQDDLITLPETPHGKTTIIESWGKISDEAGTHHVKVYFGFG